MAEGELTDEKRQSTQRDREERERRQREDDLRAVMSTPMGRRFVWRLLARDCGIFNGSFSTEALLMAHAEGRRAVGRDVMLEAQRVDPGAYLQMMKEQMESEQVAALTRQAEDAEAPDAV